MYLSMALMKPYSLFRVLSFVLFFCPLALGGVLDQGLPEAPSRHKFWDRQNKTLFLVHAGIETTDFAITHHNLANGGHEMNPLGKSLCESGTAGQVTFFAARTAGGLGISYLLHRTNHHRLERVTTMFMISDSGYGTAYSFAHRR
jgi:hypothetical protein